MSFQWHAMFISWTVYANNSDVETIHILHWFKRWKIGINVFAFVLNKSRSWKCRCVSCCLVFYLHVFLYCCSLEVCTKKPYKLLFPFIQYEIYCGITVSFFTVYKDTVTRKDSILAFFSFKLERTFFSSSFHIPSYETHPCFPCLTSFLFVIITLYVAS